MDIVKLREGFEEYIRKCFPNDNQPDVYVSDAFFLQRNEQELGLNFEDVLEKGVIPDSYGLQLENLFKQKNHKNPKVYASLHVRALRLLLEYIHSTKTEIYKQQ
jgi:hypothetical protein